VGEKAGVAQRPCTFNVMSMMLADLVLPVGPAIVVAGVQEGLTSAWVLTADRQTGTPHERVYSMFCVRFSAVRQAWRDVVLHQCQ
jgi:hypothetical protein